MTPQYALIALSLVVSSGVQAFSCLPTESQECRLELSTITIVFNTGIYNFDGDSQFNGSDGYVTGYTVGTGDFPQLNPVDTAGGTLVGFEFQPPMYAQVGGSGFNGDHEASASFHFDNLRFEARPGYRVDAVAFTVAGDWSTAGNGYVSLSLPGVGQYNGSQFTATGLFDPSTASYAAGFSANASYLEGEDGTTASYGTAYASFNFASVVAHVSAVPEPSAAWLWLAGVGVVVVGTTLRGQRSRTDPVPGFRTVW